MYSRFSIIENPAWKGLSFNYLYFSIIKQYDKSILPPIIFHHVKNSFFHLKNEYIFFSFWLCDMSLRTAACTFINPFDEPSSVCPADTKMRFFSASTCNFSLGSGRNKFCSSSLSLYFPSNGPPSPYATNESTRTCYSKSRTQSLSSVGLTSSSIVILACAGTSSSIFFSNSCSSPHNKLEILTGSDDSSSALIITV